jgi:hypothetical protein
MLHVARGEADGVIVNWCGCADIPRLRAEAGDGEFVVRLFVCRSTDAEAVRAAALHQIAAYLTVHAYAEFQRWIGRAHALEAMREAWSAGDLSPYYNDEIGAAMTQGIEIYDEFLMGRRLYDEWSSNWPNWGDGAPEGEPPEGGESVRLVYQPRPEDPIAGRRQCGWRAGPAARRVRGRCAQRIPVPPPVAWDPAAARPSSRHHGELHRRFDAGDDTVIGAMTTLRWLAHEAVAAG